MAFLPIAGDQNAYCHVGAATSTTITKGDALVDNGSGYMTTASSGGNVDIRYVAMETVTTTANGQKVLAVRTDGVTFIADTDAAWAQTDVLTEADLGATPGLVDPDASTDDIFFIEAGVTGQTKVIGHFTRGVPNS